MTKSPLHKHYPRVCNSLDWEPNCMRNVSGAFMLDVDHAYCQASLQSVKTVKAVCSTKLYIDII